MNSDDEHEPLSYDQERQIVKAKKMSKKDTPPRCVSAPGTKAPVRKAPAAPQKALPAPLPAKDSDEVGAPVTRSRAVTGPMSSPPDPDPKKTATSQRVPVDQHPMATRRQQASRAGGLRPGGGSGQTDTCVAKRNPSRPES
jgi:hypothetical protein